MKIGWRDAPLTFWDSAEAIYTSPLFPPFPSCHLTSLPYLCRLATSPLSHFSYLATSHLSPPFPPWHLSILSPFPLCHLTTLPPFQLSQLTSLPPSQLVTLVLRDLTVAININTNRICHSLIEAQPCLGNTNLRLKNKFHTLATHSHPTFTAPQVSSLPSSNTRNTRTISSTR